jgi:hypothetical protein
MGITQQIGASSLIKPGVIDNTAARPASPFEGQVIFQKDTDQLLVWNGTAWVIPNQTTTNPTALELVSSASFTGATTIDVTGFSSTYSSYKFLLDWNKTAAGGANNTVTANLRSGSTNRTGYYGSGWYQTYLGGSGYWNTASNAATFCIGDGTSGTDRSYITAEIYGMQASDIGFRINIAGTDTVLTANYNAGYVRYASDTNDTIRLNAPSAITGRWKLYGYRNS